MNFFDELFSINYFDELFHILPEAKAQYDSDKRNGFKETRGRPKLGQEKGSAVWHRDKPTAHVRPMPHVPTILTHGNRPDPGNGGSAFTSAAVRENILFPRNLAPQMQMQNQLSFFENQFPTGGGNQPQQRPNTFNPPNYLRKREYIFYAFAKISEPKITRKCKCGGNFCLGLEF